MSDKNLTPDEYYNQHRQRAVSEFYEDVKRLGQHNTSSRLNEFWVKAWNAALNRPCQSERLEAAEAVIDHYGDKESWQKQTNISILAREYADYTKNGYDKAREYRKRFPKDEEGKDES